MKHGITVLFVDDNDVLLRVLSEVLERAGYTVVQASRTEGAIGVLGSGAVKPDLVVSDVDVTDWRQHNLVAYLRAHLPRIPLLLISGHEADTARQRFGIPDGVPFLQKPFGAEVLVEKVRELLRDRSVASPDRLR